ncbi:MAG: mobile mystery protein A [Desulfobulbaceae bacterium]|nr:mobile mystery protein A [Desulfobulbaceae bacterium]
MKTKKHALVREQLDNTLKRFREVRQLSPPSKGWIRALRDALGINGRQLAKRLGVTPARISRLESDEVVGAVTIKSMQKIADSLDCVFVYGLVPRTSLEDIVKKQVAKVAKKRFAQVSHTMALEDQALSKQEQEKSLMRLEEDLLYNLPKSLWDE